MDLLMLRILIPYILITLAGLPAAFAQSAMEIPPPSDTPPPRFRIPISNGVAQIPSSDSTDENTADEQAALQLAAQAKGWVPPGSSGVLRKGMQLRVTVMIQGQTVHASEPQRINESGMIGLPLLENNILIADKSIDTIEQQLTLAYKDYYRNPLVNVEFVGSVEDPSSTPWGYVTLMGNVGSPGPIAMPPTGNLTVSGALKKSGGLAASAKEASIRIFRPIPSEQTVEVIKADLVDLGKKGEQQEDVLLQAGDVVWVPERVF
jgi:protein involved in polysaccharide export with SLBB domain